MQIDNFQFVCMINLNSNLATYPEWGQKVPPLSLFGGKKCHHFHYLGAKSATTYNKQEGQGKNPLLEQHLDGDISNAYLAVNLRSIKVVQTADKLCNISCWLINLNKN